MHALGPRVNVFFTHVMTMVFVLVGVGSSVSYMQLRTSSPPVDINISEMSFLRRFNRERCDQAYIKFELLADFTKMWSWNINHMYVYVVAEYASHTHPRNEVVVWDSIISSRAQARVHRKGQNNKYSLKDHGFALRGVDVTLKLKYNILPYMGPLYYGESGETTFSVPSNYSNSAVYY